MWAIRELESLLYKHPGVWDVAAINENEEILVVYVQLRAGFKIPAGELIQFCRQQGSHVVPKHLYVVNKLPRTKTGKIARTQLNELLPVSTW